MTSEEQLNFIRDFIGTVLATYGIIIAVMLPVVLLILLWYNMREVK